MRRPFLLLAALALVLTACGSGDVGGAVQGTFPKTLTGADEVAIALSSDPIPPQLVVDGSGVAPTGGTPEPSVLESIPGDDGSGPLPLGAVTTLPDSTRLDFLFEFCWGEPCFRDAHFMDADNPGFGSGIYRSEMPFHVRHGFVNNSDEPLGEGFDVTLYVTELDEPGEFGGLGIGDTYRYTSDYIIRGTSETCGPGYRTQTEPETCEWFVHEFNGGLPDGRHAIWAVWEAPCSAWIDYGFTDSCTDPNEVISLFSSGFDAPFGPFPPSYDEQNHATLSPQELEDFHEGW